MQIHADLNKNAFVYLPSLPWQMSPQSGVDRKMIERDGDEVARATSLVRYAKASSFPSHRHDKGEEFLVLDGVFSDDSGDFPQGMYVRNPIGSEHAPFTKNGCRILVKLRQMHSEDQTFVRIDTHHQQWTKSSTSSVQYLPLHQFASENVALVRISKPAFLWDFDFPHGLEVLLLKGEISDNNGTHHEESWLRIAPGKRHCLKAQADTLLFVKTGHLPMVDINTNALPWANFLGKDHSLK